MNQATLIDQLISHHLQTPTNSTPTTLQSRTKLRKHLLRILGSVLGSSKIGPNSENATIESIKKQLNRTTSTTTTTNFTPPTGPRPAVRFQELTGRIRRSNTITNRWSVYHVLKQLSSTGSQERKNVNRAAAVAIHATERPKPNNTTNESLTPDVDGMIYGLNGVPNDTSTFESTNKSNQRRRQRTMVEPTRFTLEENMSTETSERVLIRDVMYAFQGIDGTFVRWSDRASGYVVDPTVGKYQSEKRASAIAYMEKHL